MYITAVKLYRDTKNFFRYQIVNILLLSIICTFLNMALNYLFMPNMDEINNLKEFSIENSYGSIIDRIKKMDFYQHKIILHIAFSGILSSLIGNLLLISGVLIIISKFSKKHKKFFNVYVNIIYVLPKLFLLLLFITLLVQFGFMFFFLPGIFFITMLSVSPIILLVEKNSIIESIKNSINVVYYNINLVCPAIIFWIFFKILILILISITYTIIPIHLASIIYNAINYCCLSILVIYLSRLYMLII